MLYLLYESSSGYALFEYVKSDEIYGVIPTNDLSKFSLHVKLTSFLPYTSSENALENINAVSEGISTPYLLEWLQISLPKTSEKKQKKDKKQKSDKSSNADFQVGVLDAKLGGIIKESIAVNCVTSPLVDNLLRGIRLHFHHFIKGMSATDIHQSQLGLAHAYSRSKVKFNVHRVDNMIIQSSALVDQLDKDLNTFAMRVREWYSWHFPELYAVVSDNVEFAKCVEIIGNKSSLSAEKVEQLEEVLSDADRANRIMEASKRSMGTDISPVDLANISSFAKRVISLGEYRKNLHTYLSQKMNACAPNLTALIGEQVGARLISHAGSLTNLAKYPASTVQILGAEKALFRALKTKGNTPKYGLIYHSTFIGRAGTKNKGRISRYLANKCSIASRIDCFSDEFGEADNVFGTKLRQQVEDRLEFYRTGATPKKNIDVMREAVKEHGSSANGMDTTEDAETPENGSKKVKSEKKKRKHEDEDEEEEEESSHKSKKEKNDKKEKKGKKEEKEKKEKKQKK